MIQSILTFGASFLAPKLMAGIQNEKVQVLHALPGRVRLQCDRWKNNYTATNLEKAFKTIPLVTDVRASPITGSLLLTFATQKLTPEQFDNIVKSAVQVSVASYPELQADLMNILKNVIQTIDVTMKKQTGGKVDIDSLLSVVLMINGILKFPAQPAFSSSLLYWAYTIITKKK
ncbi:HMA2 domain-containing protein [Bacillus weihaiensis]|uniref:Uncharacterized protein n=1 Tax=Bacillus weihaiensis TaxID=1547283 RepID=A0A1L3MRC7_9BACI|nr:hypothetical protein [Bacillus weihaiensis]APH04862.1 hypothetical protein A9C19_08940 [Bacillus weihaiensis]